MVLQSVPLPGTWHRHITAAVLHAAGLARVALTASRAWCADSPLRRAQFAARYQRLQEENAQLREELRVKDARMELLPPLKRPHYPPAERLAILVLKAARGWNAAQTAQRFLLTPSTVASWLGRLDEGGPAPLVRPAQPVNRFPDLVAEVVQRLRAGLPGAGRRRIAAVLARAGVHLAASTVERLAKRVLPKPPAPRPSEAEKASRTVVRATRPHQLWHVDMTVMPTASGFWVPWWPFNMIPRWPFFWHIAVVVDHCSRAVVHAGVYFREPSGADICRLLTEAARSVGDAPRYIVTDQGSQFGSKYLDWCQRNDVSPRFGALGQHGSIAVIERFMRTMKQEGLRRVLLPLSLSKMRSELAAFLRWYNVHRPHATLGGATPSEVRDGKVPARERAAWEVRERYPLRDARDGLPRRRVMGTLRLIISYEQGRKHLPIVQFRDAA